MKSLLLLVAVLLSAPFAVQAGGSKPKTTLRIHFEVGQSGAQSPNMALKVQLPNPPIPIYVDKFATISEKNLVGAESYPGVPGSVMLTFDDQGKRQLAAVTGVSRGLRMVVFLNAFIIYCPQVDATLPNGKMLIPAGISPNNLLALQQIVLRNKKR